MFCAYCGKKINRNVFICQCCGHINIMEPIAPHIKLNPKEFVVSKILDERIIIKSKYENSKNLIITNKRIALNHFFSTEYFWINNIKYIEYTLPNMSDFYRGGIVGYMKKKIFGRDITFYNSSNVKLFELKGIENADKIFEAFHLAKTGLMKPEEYIHLPKYETSSFINGAITFIGRIIGKNEYKNNDSLYYSNNYYIEMPQSVLSDECFQKGKKCFEIGEFEKAEILFQKFCDIRPDLEYGYIFLAASLDNLKRHDEAIITYDKALKINSENINTIKMQAYALYYVGRFIEACDNFEKILKNNNNADLYFGVGCCYYKQGNLIEAIEKFNMALKQNINHTPSWLNMGYCYYELLDFNKTINCYNAAIKLQPSLSIALFYSALAHCNLGSENFKEAVELFKSSALNAPDDSDIKNEAICCITKLSNDLSGSWLKNFL